MAQETLPDSIPAETKERIIREYLATLPGREQLLLSLMNSLRLRTKYLSDVLQTGRNPFGPIDWRKYAGELAKNPEEGVEIYQRILHTAHEDERNGPSFKMVGKMVEELQEVRKQVIERTFQRRQVMLEVVKHEEYVDVEVRRGPEGEVLEATPKEGTRTAFLHLQMPGGKVIRAEIPHEDLDAVLALMWPEDFKPASSPGSSPTDPR